MYQAYQATRKEGPGDDQLILWCSRPCWTLDRLDIIKFTSCSRRKPTLLHNHGSMEKQPNIRSISVGGTLFPTEQWFLARRLVFLAIPVTSLQFNGGGVPPKLTHSILFIVLFYKESWRPLGITIRFSDFKTALNTGISPWRVPPCCGSMPVAVVTVAVAPKKATPVVDPRAPTSRTARDHGFFAFWIEIRGRANLTEIPGYPIFIHFLKGDASSKTTSFLDIYVKVPGCGFENELVMNWVLIPTNFIINYNYIYMWV